ncbi:MAG: hypothetical protein ACKOTH_05710 [Solirubrobacterales bacterium]
MRRYPDLLTHRALLSAIGAGEQAPDARELEEDATWCSERAREAMVVERDADAIALAAPGRVLLELRRVGSLLTGPDRAEQRAVGQEVGVTADR